MLLPRELRARLYYKIIIPFLLLTLLVALVGSGVAFLVITGSAQERLNNQIAQSARAVSDAIVRQEAANLQFLREAAFATANPRSGAPAVAEAMAGGDSLGLDQALDPFFRVAAQRAGLRADRLIAFDRAGSAVLDWERLRTDDGRSPRVRREPRDLSSLWFVPRILAGQRDEQGDKFAGLVDLDDSDTAYLFTVAPVVHRDEIVGGLVVAMRLDSLLTELAASSQAAIVSVYRAEDGAAVASTTLPVDGLAALNLRPSLVAPVADIAAGAERSIFDTRPVNARDYQFAYTPLRIRGATVGLISTALAGDYVTNPWADARLPLTLLTLALMAGIITTGLVVARRITRPIGELVETAQAVIAGNLERRSQVSGPDEIGVLAQSFNAMTSHLLELYRAVRADARHRAAIIESISDGVIVTDADGAVQVINRATRALLGLGPDDPAPPHINAIPFEPLENGPGLSSVIPGELFQLRDHTVRLIAAPVADDDGEKIGVVCVLQDVTAQVALDRAKSNFIATVSHEMRTPLTVIGGNLDLLLRNIVGPLNEGQRGLAETARSHIGNLSTLLNNTIMVAALDLGDLALELRPLALTNLLRDALRTHSPLFREKGLELRADMPDVLPTVLGDEHYVLKAVDQLLDNARRYSERGAVTLRATPVAEGVRVDVIDSGAGIAPELRAQLFDRFTRGTGAGQGINSSERGAGLGLAIAQQLITYQRGRLWLADTSEHGSTFSFTLPYPAAEQAEIALERGYQR